MPESGCDRIQRLGANIDRLRAMKGRIPDLADEMLHLAGMNARLGLALIDQGGVGLPLSLRRHEAVSLPETITLLEHVAGLIDGGVIGPDLNQVRDLMRSRSSALEAELISLEGMRMIRIEPELDLGLSTSSIDPKKAITAFFQKSRGEKPPEIPERDNIRGLFTDYTPDDLPAEYRKEIDRRILANPDLSRYSHAELLIILRMRDIIQRIDGFGYGVAARRRPLFSKARRSLLWSAPRIGMIMLTHVPSWKRYDTISDILLDINKYDRHMRDLAVVPEDDDYFNASDPLIRSVRLDAFRIRKATLEIMSNLRAGPSAFRFCDGFFDIMPGKNTNFASKFLEASIPVTNAMAINGIGGRGEREMAMSPEAIAEEVRDNSVNPLGIFSAIRGILRQA